MKIIHSANVYRDYIIYHKLFSKWYDNILVCGEERPNTRVTWDHDRFICLDCNFRISRAQDMWACHEPSDGGLTQKQLIEVVNHITANHFVLIRLESRLRSVVSHVSQNELVHKKTKGDRFRHPLKPWKDPQSLFCSPRLKDIINKEPFKGTECGGE